MNLGCKKSKRNFCNKSRIQSSSKDNGDIFFAEHKVRVIEIRIKTVALPKIPPRVILVRKWRGKREEYAKRRNFLGTMNAKNVPWPAVRDLLIFLLRKIIFGEPRQVISRSSLSLSSFSGLPEKAWLRSKNFKVSIPLVTIKSPRFHPTDLTYFDLETSHSWQERKKQPTSTTNAF